MALTINTCGRTFYTMSAVYQVLRNGVSGLVICALSLGFAEAAPAIAAWQLPPSVQIQHSQQALIDVDPDEIARSSVPTALFGFNIPWMNFQRGYWRNQHVRPEVIEWLKPFSGAVYRYPGGEVSNWFEWHKAVGPVALRDKQHTNFGQYAKAEFGFDEFLDFVKAVNGVPLVTVNLKGTKKDIWDDKAARTSNVAWVRYAIQREGAVGSSSLPFCQEGRKCPVLWWELGNELDWGDGAWTAERYVGRARTVGSEMLAVEPTLKLIAQTSSSPWSKKRFFGTTVDEFDRAVGEGLADIAYGYAYHPYYDGMSIPSVNHYMESAINGLSVTSSGGPPAIFITEHARWPDKPAFGDWQVNWGQTGNLGGAISTSDYLLSQMMIPNVRTAMWHALGAWGPWQLFYVNPNSDHIYPNVVYWGLRVLRQGLLDDAIKIRASSPNDSDYHGGYDVRSVFMRKADGSRYSLMTVNRSGKEQKTRLAIPKWAGRSVNARQYYITGNSKGDANVDGVENRVVMQDRTMVIQFDMTGQATISLPAFGVSSVIFEPTVGKFR